MNNKLCLHSGASEVTRDAVFSIQAPKNTETWYPIPHSRLIETVEQGLRNVGLRINGEAHALSKEGNRYFGLLQVESDQHKGSDYSYVLGLRNSIDKSFDAGLAVGSRVFVCDNLSFSGEITIGRKHTRFIERDLPILTARAVGLLDSKWVTMDERLALYKRTEVSDLQAHDLLVRSLDCGAITGCQLPKILTEWRKPRHPEFVECGKTGWRLFNAFTEIAKENPVAILPKRTINLHALLDNAFGFKLQANVTEGTVDTAVVINN